MRRIARYGWVPDRPDRRDLRFQGTAAAVEVTPDWSAGMPAAFNQGRIGSCTGNMFAAQAYFLRLKANPVDKERWIPSRLFAYYVARMREGTTRADAGAMIRDVLAGAITEGICPEPLWPYSELCVTLEPSPEAFERAQFCEVLDYRRVDNTNVDELFAALQAGPLCAGFTLYDSFESTDVTRTGVVPMPDGNEGIVGGHALWLCRGDRRRGLVKFRNSWGPGWGARGYGWFPLEYVTDGDLAADFWAVNQVSG